MFAFEVTQDANAVLPLLAACATAYGFTVLTMPRSILTEKIARRGYHIHRVVTNRWDLARTSSGWKIKRRTLRLVDGSEPSRDILRGALGAYAS